VIGIRWLVGSAVIVLAAGTSASGLDVFGRKSKSEAQIKRLTDTVKNEADEGKRRAALAELIDADPRQHPDVITALVAVLQKDGSWQVRAAAADVLGRYKFVYPVAGLALEAAAELDPSPAVRKSAQQALWEYHLAGYRSLRGVGGIVGQTAEPPIAARTPRPTIAPATVVAVIPPAPPAPRPLADLPPLAPQPAVSIPRPTPRGPLATYRPSASPVARLLSLLPAKAAEREPSSGPPDRLTLTPEPPIALPRVLPVAPAPKCVGSPALNPDGDRIELPGIAGSPGEPVSARTQAPSLPLRVPVAPGLPGPRVRLPR
jgi:hypothetical protein